MGGRLLVLPPKPDRLSKSRSAKASTPSDEPRDTKRPPSPTGARDCGAFSPISASTELCRFLDLVPHRHAAPTPQAKQPVACRPMMRRGWRREAVIVEEVDAAALAVVEWQSQDLQISIDRIRAVMHHFQGDRRERKSIAKPSRKLWTRLARAGWAISPAVERLDGQLRRTPPCRVEGWDCDQ